METIASSSDRRMPYTPIPFRPVARTSLSRKRTAAPCFVISISSVSSFVTLTSISWSSSRREIAMIPSFLILANAASFVFLMMPRFVAMKR